VASQRAPLAPRAVFRIDRLPIRVHVTLDFAGVMAVVLGGVGLFLYVRLGTELDATLEQGLRSRAGDVTALVEQPDSGLARSGRSPLTEQGENLAQILDASGRVVDSTPSLRDRRQISTEQLGRARRGTILVKGTAGEQGARMLATPVTAQGRRLVVPVADDEIGRLGDTLNAMLELLEAAFARERTFVSNASHELRTPLAILKAELELAPRGGRSDATDDPPLDENAMSPACRVLVAPQ